MRLSDTLKLRWCQDQDLDADHDPLSRIDEATLGTMAATPVGKLVIPPPLFWLHLL